MIPAFDLSKSVLLGETAAPKTLEQLLAVGRDLFWSEMTSFYRENRAQSCSRNDLNFHICHHPLASSQMWFATSQGLVHRSPHVEHWQSHVFPSSKHPSAHVQPACQLAKCVCWLARYTSVDEDQKDQYVASWKEHLAGRSPCQNPMSTRLAS